MSEIPQNTSEQKPTVEERLMPWIEQGEYVIIMTLVIMAWAGGWVNLLGYNSERPVILGRYSLILTGILALYSAVFLLWFWIFGTLRGLDWLKDRIDYVQRHWWVFLVSLIVISPVFVSMFLRRDIWQELPILQITSIFLVVLYSLVVLFAKPVDNVPIQSWRLIAQRGLIGLVAIELVLQMLAAVGLLPFQHLEGLTIPYGRVYQSQIGFANNVQNRIGWNAPDFEPIAGEENILLVGGSVVQALQVSHPNHFARDLEQALIADGQPAHVIALGQPDYGTSTRIQTSAYSHLWEGLYPTEIVVFYHLANDFHMEDPGDSDIPRMILDENGEPIVHPDDQEWWHDNAHIVVDGARYVPPGYTVLTQSLLLGGINQLLGYPIETLQPPPDMITALDLATDEQPFGPTGPAYQENPDAYPFEIAEAQLSTLKDFLVDYDITLRLVTLPYFPPSFYEQNTGNEWSPELGGYNLMVPEEELRAIAEELDISFLGLTEYMESQSPDEIRSFFFAGGELYLTAAGHDFVGEAVYQCFYASSSDTAIPGCDQAGQP